MLNPVHSCGVSYGWLQIYLSLLLPRSFSKLWPLPTLQLQMPVWLLEEVNNASHTYPRQSCWGSLPSSGGGCAKICIFHQSELRESILHDRIMNVKFHELLTDSDSVVSIGSLLCVVYYSKNCQAHFPYLNFCLIWSRGLVPLTSDMRGATLLM